MPGGLLFCSLFGPTMLCEEAPSVGTLLSTISSIDIVTSIQILLELIAGHH